MSRSQKNALRRHATRIIGLGFGVVITLMLVLAATTLMRLDRIQAHIREISDDHGVHVQLAHLMYDFARERSYLLFKIAHTNDPFLADELTLRFRELSFKFGQARQTLLKQRLVPEELALLEKQRQATENTCSDRQRK